MTKTNATTITTKQIKALRNEAMAAGDYHQADWCEIAMAAHERADEEGNDLIAPNGAKTTRSKARAICARVINAAGGENESGGATDEQIKTIRARAYNSNARAMAAHGVNLTWAQADSLSDESRDWIGNRLGLKVRTTDRGIVCTPR